MKIPPFRLVLAAAVLIGLILVGWIASGVGELSDRADAADQRSRLQDADVEALRTEVQARNADVEVLRAQIEALGGVPAAPAPQDTQTRIIPVPGKPGEPGQPGPAGPAGLQGQPGERGQDGTSNVAPLPDLEQIIIDAVVAWLNTHPPPPGETPTVVYCTSDPPRSERVLTCTTTPP